MKKFIYILLLLISATSLFSQAITWQRTYWSPHGPDTDVLRSIVCLSGGDYIAVGTTRTGIDAFIYAMRINAYGDTIWTKLLPGGDTYSMEKTNDNNFIIAGYYSKLLKINENGDVIWVKGPYNNSAYITSVKQTKTNGYIMCGRLNNGINSYPYVLLTDSLGNLLWQKSFTLGISSGNFKDLIIRENGNIILTGNYNKPDSLEEDLLVVKVDIEGNIISFTGFDSLSAYYVETIENTNDNGFLIGGVSARNGYNSFLIKLDSLATIKWLKFFDVPQPYHFMDIRDIIITYNNFYILIGWSDTIPGGDTYSRIIKVDSLGNEHWRRLYGFLNDNSIAFCGRETNDSGFIIVGTLTENRNNLYIVKTDSNGFANPPNGIKQISNNIPKDISLFQNYPNPFNNKTKIKFQIQQKGFAKLQLFDVLGREISLLLNKYLSVGEYQLDFNASNLSSGTYFLNLFLNNNFINSIKIIITK